MPPAETSDDAPVRGRRQPAAGYRKGEATRARFLEVALAVFGREGFAGATTRRIAEEAGASLPTLNYYFGDKEGLYRACAEEIARRSHDAISEIAIRSAEALRAPMPPAAARNELKRLFGALVRFVMTSDGGATRALFVQREMTDPGAAAEILYGALWSPAIELIGALISRAMGQPETLAEARVRAVLLLSSLTAFQTGRMVIDRALGEQGAGLDQVAVVTRVIEEQIDAIGPA
ncbi:CerR family C-terminal domain-containing protein [Caulobacter mirabilis]|uniref:TetR family transcriptional regulator n=1 Tax=Caulobacter mirabilis TaxID=69666 RepID=A0A2D2AW98_9CAUL|nr:CerR family C-terminal domain-containing protein [Caulobacter mirabilis]ATQ42245.1 TetR family transcriptional regulator [Caulobacter mirabilis]